MYAVKSFRIIGRCFESAPLARHCILASTSPSDRPGAGGRAGGMTITNSTWPLFPLPGLHSMKLQEDHVFWTNFFVRFDVWKSIFVFLKYLADDKIYFNIFVKQIGIFYVVLNSFLNFIVYVIFFLNFAAKFSASYNQNFASVVSIFLYTVLNTGITVIL